MRTLVVPICAAAWGCTGEIGDRWEGAGGAGQTSIGSPTTTGSGVTGASGVGGSNGTAGEGPGEAGSAPPPGAGGSSGTGGPIVGGGSDAGSFVGFCDVQSILRARCVSCHSNPPIAGAPMPLVAYADLMAPARSDPTSSVARVALARMQDATRPMPPAPAMRATAAEIGIVSDWITAGSPAACSSTPPDGGAGGPADASTGPVADAAPPVVVCTSGQHWTQGNNGSANMHPGGACIACHGTQEEEAPRFTIAGTVYPTLNEPNDCNGINGGGVAQVVITGADGRTLTLGVNAVGNFSSTTTVAGPFHAKVVRNGIERAMTVAQTAGDCNSCHTERGANGAPGRIMAP